MIHNSSINMYRAGGGTDAMSAIHNLGLNTVIDGSPIGGAQPLDAPAFGGSGAYPADPYMGVQSHEFTNGVDGYIGFVLDETSNPLYGWMRVELHDDGTPGLIKEWAFSDSSILVGQIPEPSVPVLVVIATGTLALRRRRKG